MHHCWNKMTCRQHNLKTSIQMFRNIFFVTPLWDDAYALQGKIPFPCFKWLKLDNSPRKENGTLLLKYPTSFLTRTNTQWRPLFIKEGGMIQPVVNRFTFDRFALTCLADKFAFDRFSLDRSALNTPYQHALRQLNF